jgi:amino acid transporter
MAMTLKRFLLGRPIATAQAIHERLSKRVALAVFSSDALSSTAYATEEILLVLAVAAAYTHSNALFWYVLPISVAIAGLLWIVSLSYRQTIHAYPSGGGAYIVAKDNLGVYAGLTAAAALLVDYVLTVSVSVSAGVAAITSVAQGTALAGLSEHRVALCVAAILVITLANLRGVRESGAIFSIPTYVFVVGFIGMIVWGVGHYLTAGTAATPASEALKFAEGYRLQPLSTFLLLGAFANGCAALTGVEAISNGITAFKQPESQNAATTLLWMVVILSIMFLGTSLLAYLYQVHPREHETVISQFARTIFTGPMGWAYYLIQGATAAILVLAANTSFADFPRLASLLARDRFLPRQLSNQGDRLVFSNGVLILAVCSSLLVWIFAGDTSRLIPLYAVGVFLSFTLSQAGMVRHWLRERDQSHASRMAAEARQARSARPGEDVARSVSAVFEVGGWKKSILLNGLGALATAIVLGVFILTKFLHGAWVVVVLIPLLVLLFRAIHNHYQQVSEQLALRSPTPVQERRHTVILPIAGVHRAIISAVEYARSISHNVHAVYVEIDPATTPKLKADWEKLQTGIELQVLQSPYRSLMRPLLDYIDAVDATDGNNLLTVVLPEFVPARWWHQMLHNQSAWLIRAALYFRPGVIVTSVPYHLQA